MKLLTSNQWEYLDNVFIQDPDGWDRGNFTYSWFEELISKEEYERRKSLSTTIG